MTDMTTDMHMNQAGMATARPDDARFTARLDAWHAARNATKSRADEIAELHALSDEELAARGVIRECIVHHVYARDMYG